VNPLVQEFTVACPPEYAWAVWARHSSLWWPATHSVSACPRPSSSSRARAGGSTSALPAEKSTSGAGLLPHYEAACKKRA
jgi:hypothetical protein